MTYSNRSNYVRNARSGGGGGIPNNPPATMLILIEGKRMAVINTFSKNDGTRSSAVHFCDLTETPASVANIASTHQFGVQSNRVFTSPDEAKKFASQWLNGEDMGGNDL